MTDTREARTTAIRTLNDAARAHPGALCRCSITLGVDALPIADRIAILRQIVTYDAFTDDNDPHNEHDFGSLYRLASGAWTPERPDDADQIAQTVCWKFDYYDLALEFGSAEPWNAAATARVLTIMLASEY
ncbi:DUF3768 domain-containing protein [Sphingomonas sp. BK345]|uniref:DUF3768 domain-containing protein n=1 Tax=Sphingomonas sp. BK345 TaxID=2586980 RepID=UPI001618EC74|nr:DUF3768 domain-containing protein [Sphingomonas sp. BK345]MBB3475864.1 hypothetical protein [Sphingomonas sp. BK345]